MVIESYQKLLLETILALVLKSSDFALDWCTVFWQKWTENFSFFSNRKYAYVPGNWLARVKKRVWKKMTTGRKHRNQIFQIVSTHVRRFFTRASKKAGSKKNDNLLQTSNRIRSYWLQIRHDIRIDLQVRTKYLQDMHMVIELTRHLGSWFDWLRSQIGAKDGHLPRVFNAQKNIGILVIFFYSFR
jgi:hypothetical protein